MDPKLLYWTGAFVNMCAVFLLAARGVAQARRGEVDRHKRCMLTSGALVVAFLLSYVLKVLFLGREDFSLWSAASLRVLQFHETCVVVMLLAGGVALSRAWKMRGTRRVTHRAEDPQTSDTVLRWHRRSGWTSVVGAALGFASSAFVLYGMYARL